MEEENKKIGCLDCEDYAQSAYEFCEFSEKLLSYLMENDRWAYEKFNEEFRGLHKPKELGTLKTEIQWYDASKFRPEKSGDYLVIHRMLGEIKTYSYSKKWDAFNCEDFGDNDTEIKVRYWAHKYPVEELIKNNEKGEDDEQA